MIYNTAVEQIKGAKTAQAESMLPILRLATVTSLSGDRALIQFFGESTASSKLYPYIAGYKPTVNDTVLVFEQGSTYIIAGKISKGAVGSTYYITKAILDAANYLTKAVADTLYQPIGSSSNPLKISNDKYSFGFSSSTSSNLIQSWKGTDFDTRLTLGASGSPFGDINANQIQIFNNSSILPYQSNSSCAIGSTSKMFKYGYFDTLGGTSANYAIQQLNIKNSTIYGTTISVNSNNSVNVGASGKQFNNVYAKQFYQNGTAISTSDRRKKTGIKDFTKKYIEFFKKLKPKLFRFKDGESGRLHSGFIAQDVEEAAAESGIPTKDLAFLCIDEDGNYGLRYEELIALQTKVIQGLMARVEVLEEKIKGR